MLHRDALRRERQRQIALASQGQKNLRGRVQNKKGREVEKMMGAKKHEEAMREMARRKTEQSSRKIAAARSNGRVQMPNRGIAAGVKSKNKHMQDFEKLKQGNKKRTGEVLCANCADWIWIFVLSAHIGNLVLN